MPTLGEIEAMMTATRDRAKDERLGPDTRRPQVQGCAEGSRVTGIVEAERLASSYPAPKARGALRWVLVVASAAILTGCGFCMTTQCRGRPFGPVPWTLTQGWSEPVSYRAAARAPPTASLRFNFFFTLHQLVV